MNLADARSIDTKKLLRIGDLVVALCAIRELDEYVDILHAAPGDVGVIVGLSDCSCPTVRFEREGRSTVTDCYHEGEVTLLRAVDMTVRKLAHA